MQVGPTVLLMPPAQHPGKAVYSNYRSKVSKGIGITQIVLGVVVILCCCPGLPRHPVESLNGIGCGVLFIVTGAIAHAASRKKTQCYIAATLMLAILSACTAAMIINPAIEGAAWGGEGGEKDGEGRHEGGKGARHHKEDSSHGRDEDGKDEHHTEGELIAGIVLNSILVVVACLMVILSLVLSGFGCGAMCCQCCCGGSDYDKKSGRPQTPPPAYYATPIAVDEKKQPLPEGDMQAY